MSWRKINGEHVITASSGNTYKFEGKERDAETNNDNFGARYYSSTSGRFLSADWSAVPAPVPYANLTNPQTLNLYAMVSDNPESFADLDGHCAVLSLGTCAPTAPSAFPQPPALSSEEAGCLVDHAFCNSGQLVAQQQGQDTAPPPPPTPAPPPNALQRTEYGTKDEAARAAETNILGTSLQQGVEYGFRGYKNPDGTYSTTAPKTDGNPITVTLPPVSDLPPGAQNAFRGHTHPDVPGYDHEHFSRADKQNAQSEHVPSYIGTANHKFKKYDPSAPVNHRITTLGVIP